MKTKHLKYGLVLLITYCSFLLYSVDFSIKEISYSQLLYILISSAFVFSFIYAEDILTMIPNLVKNKLAVIIIKLATVILIVGLILVFSLITEKIFKDRVSYIDNVMFYLCLIIIIFGASFKSQKSNL